MPTSSISMSRLSSAIADRSIGSPRTTLSAATVATPAADEPPSPAPIGKSLATEIDTSLTPSRFVAASTMARSAAIDGAATQRHRCVARDCDVAYEAAHLVGVRRHVGPAAAEVDARGGARDDDVAHVPLNVFSARAFANHEPGMSVAGSASPHGRHLALSGRLQVHPRLQPRAVRAHARS